VSDNVKISGAGSVTVSILTLALFSHLVVTLASIETQAWTFTAPRSGLHVVLWLFIRHLHQEGFLSVADGALTMLFRFGLRVGHRLIHR
jgi:hypothetical protein